MADANNDKVSETTDADKAVAADEAGQTDTAATPDEAVTAEKAQDPATAAEDTEDDAKDAPAAEDASDDTAADDASASDQTTAPKTRKGKAKKGKKGAKADAGEEKKEDDSDLSEDVKSTVDSLLDSSALDSKDAPSNIKKLATREKDNNRRVQDSIKNAKTNPKWFVPLFVSLLIIGLAWVIVFYATSQSGPGYPIPTIGNWNLLIGFLIMLAGFIMTMWWN